MEALQTLIASSLEPIPPFTWFGLSISTLDVAATTRLVLIMRQLREMAAVSATRDPKSASAQVKWDAPSPVRDLFATWTVVFGGEWVACVLVSRYFINRCDPYQARFWDCSLRFSLHRLIWPFMVQFIRW
jgi:hypothetical protein